VAEFTSHLPGTFSWPELSTTDQKGGSKFYSTLFGWDVNDIPMGPDSSYTMFQMRGLEVGAASTLMPDQKAMGVPSHWNSYVTVKNVDETVKQAQALGGHVLAPAFDVMDAGRMAVLQDPTGAVFQVWQSNKSIGAKILAEPGTLCWTELTTSDLKAAEAFYSKLFGWTLKHGAVGAPMEYTEFSAASAPMPQGGMMAKPAEMPKHIPSYWMPYFLATNLDTSTSKAKELGARLMVGPQEIPDAGRFVVMNDPQGAIFAMFQPKM